MPARLVNALGLLLALGCLHVATIHAQETGPQMSLRSLHAQFDTALKAHGVVGGGLAVIHWRDTAAYFSYGAADVRTGKPVDIDTAYNWASITKTFTAIAILQLRDRGLLQLDDPAVRYVPELSRVHDVWGPVDVITIRELLTHSAGFRNPTWPWSCDDAADCSWQPFEPTRWSQIVAMLPYTNVAFKPGTRWSYSNLGYVFLGQIIQHLSGDDFEAYVDKNILMPLGMTASYFDRAPYSLEDHVSASYLRIGGKLQPQPFNFDTGITTSNSGLKAPIADMVKYLRFLIGDSSNPVYDTVLRRSSLQEAWNGILAANDHQPDTIYTTGPHGAQPMMGLGFFEFWVTGHQYVYHDGDQGGFSSEMIVDPAGHSAAILVVNTTDTGTPQAVAASHPQSNTEPDARTDLRLTLRHFLVDKVFPALAQPGK
ncbi:MAG TPA: serine hydrolase domain-containing protein [Terracidiphilus sp.]|nr:serine hydrolase domain-containing protein [Terracidiphilus sp.]